MSGIQMDRYLGFHLDGYLDLQDWVTRAIVNASSKSAQCNAIDKLASEQSIGWKMQDFLVDARLNGQDQYGFPPVRHCPGEFADEYQAIYWCSVNNMVLFVTLALLTGLWLLAHVMGMFSPSSTTNRWTHAIFASLFGTLYVTCLCLMFLLLDYERDNALINVHSLLRLGNPMLLLSLGRTFNVLTITCVHVLSALLRPPIGVVHRSFANLSAAALRQWPLLCLAFGSLVEVMYSSCTMFPSDNSATRAYTRICAVALLGLAAGTSILYPDWSLGFATLAYCFACHVMFTADIHASLPGEPPSNLPSIWFWRGGIHEPVGAWALTVLILSCIGTALGIIEIGFAAKHWKEKGDKQW